MKIKLIIYLLFFTFTTSQTMAQKASLLTFDKSEITKDGMPRNFRDLSVIGINAIASAQFSEDELQKLRQKYPNEKIVIVDLRQESHGFINGKPVLWRSYFEKINQNKEISEILSDEKSRLDAAKKDHEIVINEVVKRDKESGWYEDVAPKIVIVNQTISEKDLAQKNGFEYQRFSIRDFDIPETKEFSRMINFIKNLPEDKKIYVHCAGGRGGRSGWRRRTRERWRGAERGWRTWGFSDSDGAWEGRRRSSRRLHGSILAGSLAAGQHIVPMKTIA